MQTSTYLFLFWLCCWINNKCCLWTHSASVHMLTRQSRRMSIITSLVHGLAMFFLALATQISRPQSALRFLNLLPLRVRWGPVHQRELETQVLLLLCITEAATCVNCANCCKLHALFADVKRYVLRLVEENLLPDGVNARKHTNTDSVLGTFAKLQKAIIISIMSVRPSDQPSVCPPGRICLPLDEYWRNSIFEDYLKALRENSGLTKIWQE
jgi:hypothetical protein